VTAPGSAADLDWLDRRIGYKASDAGLVGRALTHRSAAGADNERLEFLGDAVLSFVVADLLYTEFASADEGELSRFRAALVREETLADMAEALGVGDRLRLGPGELRSGGFRRRSILADAFEALLGAIYLEGGVAAATAVVERFWRPRIEALRDAPPLKDPKTRLQEWLQARGRPLPAYAVEAIGGDAHAQVFTVSCAVPGTTAITEGRGASRRRAEQIAAELALQRLEAEEDDA
jgi:ribonuclease-3